MNHDFYIDTGIYLRYNLIMSRIHDVAKQAGVSTATVSRTFSTPDLINDRTQQRVLEVARQLDYQPRRGRAVARAKPENAPTQTIGFQFFSATARDRLQTNTFYASILDGAQSEASLLGMHLMLHSTDRYSLSENLPRMILEQAVGGMLLVGTAEPAILAAFAQHVPKIVLVDNKDETDTYESVLSDGCGGAFAATQYLLKLGHRRIGFLLGERSVMTFQDRQSGYLFALFEEGIPADPQIVISGDTQENVLSNIADLLRSTTRPTAVLAANDYHASLLVRVCREMGIRIPDDLSVVGFDDIPLSSHNDPPLTTVRVDTESMGRLAVRRLHTRLHSDSPESVSNHSYLPSIRNVMPVSLIVRDSCRAI